jgi:sugar lactone lactonase YvrE
VKRKVEVVLRGGSFLESPRWHDGRWWYSDLFRSAVFALAPDAEAEETIVRIPGRPSGLGWLPDGSLLVVSMLDRRILRLRPDGVLSEHADLTAHFSAPANDMVANAQGHAWVGTLGFQMSRHEDPLPGSLVHVSPSGAVRPAAQDLLVPNGMVLTADGSTLIVAETIGSRLTSFSVTPDGRLENRAVWAQLGPTPRLSTLTDTLAQLQAGPDGIALDAEGCVWAADPVAGHCNRVRAGGEIVETIESPHGQRIFACALGGHNGRDLLLCCAPDASEKRRSKSRDAVLARCEVDVGHSVEHAGYL